MKPHLFAGFEECTVTTDSHETNDGLDAKESFAEQEAYKDSEVQQDVTFASEDFEAAAFDEQTPETLGADAEDLAEALASSAEIAASANMVASSDSDIASQMTIPAPALAATATAASATTAAVSSTDGAATTNLANASAAITTVNMAAAAAATESTASDSGAEVNIASQFAKMMRLNGRKLTSGDILPAVGFGTYALPEGNDAVKAVAQAVLCGYRAFDCAAFYGNEPLVGRGLRLGASKLGLKREDFFVTSKVWPSHWGYQKTMDSFFKSINDLDLDYLDLYLIHWPASPNSFENWNEINLSTWKALIQLYEEGYVRSIGVSNFKDHHLRALLDTAVQPMVNQLEFHPGFSQQSLLQFCRMVGIVVEGWSPFGRASVLNHEILRQLAQKYQHTVTQICLRFAYQMGVVPLPKASSTEHMCANLQFLDFELEQNDMNLLLSLDHEQLGYSGEDSDLVTFNLNAD